MEWTMGVQVKILAVLGGAAIWKPARDRFFGFAFIRAGLLQIPAYHS
jgi:hypothetical protein